MSVSPPWIKRSGALTRMGCRSRRSARRTDDAREVRTVTIDPDCAEHIIWAFDAYATGEWSVTRLAAELEARGLRTTPGPNTPAKPLTVNGLHRLLRNTYYKGVVDFNGAEDPDGTSQ